MNEKNDNVITTQQGQFHYNKDNFIMNEPDQSVNGKKLTIVQNLINKFKKPFQRSGFGNLRFEQEMGVSNE